jgi:cytochrome c6
MNKTLILGALGALAFAAAGSALAANALPTSPPPEPTGPAQSGEAMFMENCSACHQATGLGIPGAFPALKGDKIVLGPAPEMATLVLNGTGGMPTFKGELTDNQLSAILTYVRSAWGNTASAVTPDVVLAARSDQPPVKSSASQLQAH